MSTAAVADEVIRYLYLASLRPLATLALLVTLIGLVLLLAAIAWHEHRLRCPARGRTPFASAGARVSLVLLGALAVPLLLP